METIGRNLAKEMYHILYDLGFHEDPNLWEYIYISEYMYGRMLDHFEKVESKDAFLRFDKRYKKRSIGLFRYQIEHSHMFLYYFDLEYQTSCEKNDYHGLLIPKEYSEAAFKTIADLHKKYGEKGRSRDSIRDLSWNRIFLQSKLKNFLKNDFERFLESRDFYKKELRLPWKRGYMFYGPPGNGKTLLIKILADVYDLATYDMKWAVRDGEIEISSHKDTNPFQRIYNYVYPGKSKPTIYYIEDIDKFTAAQGSDDNPTVQLHSLVKALDGVVEIDEVIIIATTNEMNFLCDALANRPGRFDVVKEIGMPDVECIQLFLKYYNFEIAGGNECLAESMIKDKFTMAYVEDFIKVAKTYYKKNILSIEEMKFIYAETKSHVKSFEDKFKIDGGGVGFGTHTPERKDHIDY